MNAYHLDLLQNHIKQALDRYCVLCDASREREYLTGKTVFFQTEKVVRQYLHLFQALKFLDSDTEYYREGFVKTYSTEDPPKYMKGASDHILTLIAEAYQELANEVTDERYFLPVLVHQVSDEEIRIYIGVVNEELARRTVTVVGHTTIFPSTAASVGNNRYEYLLKLLQCYDPDEIGSLEQFVQRSGFDYRQLQKDSRVFLGNTFYRHYLKLRMIPVLEDLLLSTLSYKEIAYKNGFTGYRQLYSLFHKIYHFPLHAVPRIMQEKSL